ncbi:DUF6932 family protein [Myxococcota bacterium]
MTILVQIKDLLPSDGETLEDLAHRWGVAIGDLEVEHLDSAVPLTDEHLSLPVTVPDQLIGRIQRSICDTAQGLHGREGPRATVSAFGPTKAQLDLQNWQPGKGEAPLVLDERGLLRPGIHDATFEDLKATFGRFQTSAQRIRLCNQIQQYLEELESIDFMSTIIVDGSFVTSKEEPNDVDIILVLRADHDLSRELKPFEQNAVSSRRIRKRYDLDVLVARDGGAELDEYLGYFAQVRGESGLKGMVRVRL